MNFEVEFDALYVSAANTFAWSYFKIPSFLKIATIGRADIDAVTKTIDKIPAYQG